jgi:hypothetical protein
MLRYTSFKCDTCRRTKDILTDASKVTLNYCTITKGCLGSLQITGDTNYAVTTSPVEGVEDWYPRGTEVIKDSGQTATVEHTDISTSVNGIITIGIPLTVAEAVSSTFRTVQIKFLSRKIEPIAFQEYAFKPQTDVISVSGRDLNGKNLRLDALAFTQDRVKATVNGVVRTDIALDTQTLGLKFDALVPAQARIFITVSASAQFDEKILTFQSHHFKDGADEFGAWGNLRNVAKMGATGVEEDNRLWLYSCTEIRSLANSASLICDTILDANNMAITTAKLQSSVFLLASNPYMSADRYFNLVLPFKAGTVLSIPSGGEKRLNVDRQLIGEVFPPLRIVRSIGTGTSSRIGPDVIPAVSAAIPVDTELTRLQGQKIIGPV